MNSVSELKVEAPVKGVKGKIIRTFIIFLVIISALILVSNRNYMLFHTSIELFSSIIAFSILLISVNTYNLSKNYYVLILGIGYGFVAWFDTFHALSYQGMRVFGEQTANMSTQFWIAARYVETITLLLSCLVMRGRIRWLKTGIINLVFLVLSSILFISIFNLKIFPDCFIIGSGLTIFKVASEYIICFLLILSAYILQRSRKNMDSEIFLFVQFSIITTILSEIIFTLYNDPYGITNMLGHIIKVISFYFVYKAIIEKGLNHPYKLLFNELNKTNSDLEKRIWELQSTSERLEREKSERRRMESILIRNEQCYDLLIENSPVAIMVHSEGIVVFANKSAARLFGLGCPDDIVGMELMEFIYDDCKEMVGEILKNAYTVRQAISPLEIKVKTVSGSIVDVEITRTQFIYKGKSAVLGILRDITPRNQVERLKKDVEENTKLLRETREFNRLITEFFANISHELRTPLNVILGAIQIMSVTNDDLKSDGVEKNDRYIKIMKQNCYRLLRLVNNLIDMSKIDSGFLELHLKNEDIICIVEDITLSVVDYVENRGVNITFDTDIEERILACDPDKIERIMLNLLSNAIKFTRPGDSIMVSVSDRGEKIVISVKDTGIGIPENNLHVIFERFRQVNKSLTRDHEGSGIGLSLVKSLVEMHGGTIGIKSEVDKGSEFIIEFPVRLLEEDNSIHQENRETGNIERISIEFSDIYS